MLSSRSTWISGSNWLQNDTDIRQFQFVVNGVDQTLKNLRLEGLQCIHGDCPQDAIKPVPLGDAKYWSDLGTWPSGQLPQEGEDVHIEPGMNVILDIETPKLNLLIINGRLSFLDYTDPIHLHAKQIYIRAGELLVGSETEPFQADAQISLYGMRNEQTEIMSGSVITGNKVIYNTGTLSMHGMPRDRHSRMRMSVYKDMTMALVDPGLDWVAGEKVYFAPTNHQWTHSEYKTIDSYNVNTGELFLTTPFEFYHFGQDQSTAADYNGVDTRGEVRLLTRNVRVVGADEGDKWGGNIFTNDRMEFDGTFRQGTTQLDYVEVAQCSQENTYNAAIRFESTGETGLSYIKNTVVHNSQAWSLLIDSSKNILVQDSDFIGAKAVGVNLKSISNVKMDGLFVADVMKRVWQGGDKTVDKEACVAYCSYWEPNRCFDNQLTNSIAAGCAFAGFVAPGHDCDDNDSMIFRNNVAHSGERVGGHIYPNPALAQSGTCYKGSHFSAYKNRDGGLQTMYKTMEMRMHDMTFIDNEKGVGLQISGETEYNRISMYDVEIYGEDNNSDVPDGQSMYCKDKYGLMLFGGARGSKPLHPTMASSLPIHKIKSYASWGTEVVLSRVNFNNFQSEVTRKCGRKHSAMQRNPTAADYIPTHLFQYTKFTDVSETAVIWMEDPNPAWANPTDCIEWPCTAPENVVLKFEGTTYGGVTQPLNTASNFQIVSDAEEAVRAYSNCQLRDYWSAAWCNNRNLGVLLFESLDADTEDRSIQPVVITNSVTGYSNALNSFMDHMWDGFYTGQKRLSRFPSQIEALGDYTMEFTGTPANNMRFTLKADVGGIKIKIPYPNAGSYTVFADGVEMPYTPWDKELGRHAELTKTKGCGENRYVGVENFLEFYIMPECEIKIVPRDAIMVSVRLDWTLDEFYSADGVDNFVDRMAAVLDVHASQIKVVAVYEGSVIIEYFVETLPDDEEPEKTLNEAQLKFYDAVLSGELDLGAPVIDAMASGQVIKTDYSGDHYQGKDGNIWDHLIDNNNQNGGNNSSGGDGSSNNNGSSDTNGSSDQTGDQGQQDGTSGQIDEQNFSKVTTETTIVTEEESPAMTETFKYLIVFLAVLSVALLIVIGYIAMRMCTKRRMKPINLARRASQPNQDFQYAGDDTKDIFSDRKRRKRKVNDADEHQVRQSETPVSSDRLAPPQTAVMTDSASNGGETNRALQTASR